MDLVLYDTPSCVQCMCPSLLTACYRAEYLPWHIPNSQDCTIERIRASLNPSLQLLRNSFVVHIRVRCLLESWPKAARSLDHASVGSPFCKQGTSDAKFVGSAKNDTGHAIIIRRAAKGAKLILLREDLGQGQMATVSQAEEWQGPVPQDPIHIPIHEHFFSQTNHHHRHLHHLSHLFFFFSRYPESVARRRHAASSASNSRRRTLAPSCSNFFFLLLPAALR